MWGVISGAFTFLAKLMGFISDRQLLDAGKAEQSAADLKATQDGAVEGQKIDATVSTASDADLDRMLK